MTEITIQELERVINLCLAQELAKSNQIKSIILPKACRPLADLYGMMIYHKQTVIPITSVKPEILDAIAKWIAFVP